MKFSAGPFQSRYLPPKPDEQMHSAVEPPSVTLLSMPLRTVVRRTPYRIVRRRVLTLP